MGFLDTLRAIAEADGATVRIGWTDPEVARIQAINEAGSRDGRRPPARPVLLPALDASAELIAALTGRAVAEAAAGRGPERALDELGRRLADEVRARIYGATPGNAPSTIKRKGYDAPLRGPRDRILDGVTHEVTRA